MAASLNHAKEWLSNLRQFYEENMGGRVMVLITEHACNCPCRELSRPKLFTLLRDASVWGQWRKNEAASAKQNSLVLHLSDPDPEMEVGRRKIELTVLFPEGENAIPIVISAWREGSPKSRESDCRQDSDVPPCLQANRIRGRIA